MAQYAYVMTDGANDGTRASATSFTSLQTGAFSGLGGVGFYYASISSALTNNTLVSGDYIVCANEHDIDYAIATILTVPTGVIIISVNETGGAIEDYLAGATESTSVSDISVQTSLGGTVRILGVTFSTLQTNGDDILFDTSNGFYYSEDMTGDISDVSVNNFVIFTGDGSLHSHRNLDLSFVTAAQGVTVNDPLVLEIIGGSVTYNGATASVGVFQFVTLGATIHVSNYDFSGIGAGGQIFENTGIADDATYGSLTRCLLPASCVIAGTIAAPNQSFDAWSCDTGDGYHYFEHHRYEGKVLESTTVKRTGGAHYDQANPTTTLFSAEFQPNANVVAYTQPLRMAIKHFELDLTSANTLTFHLAMQDTAVITASTITNDKYWIEIEQNSDTATSKALGITIDTKPADILATATALANVATTWTGRTLTYEDEFQIPVTTTVVSGMTNGQVTAYLCCAEYVSTREIFVCPDPVVT